ncbi:MAG: small multi-drug export protein, partial [Candidatus Thermoplasmatota archaeon]|nr:small multi-drug export protein [Candidatus Thermoplasmatota archaeon]MEC7426104.1 small multi-drug export protein [Candidatus Thermoplasmatota archaeon]
MVEKDLSSIPSEVDENMDKAVSYDADLDDKLDQELDRIRDRRENPGKSFLVNTIVPRTFDDYTLVFGVMTGLVFFGMVTLASSGLVLGDSISIDDTLSGTPLDPNDCVDRRGEVWIKSWVQGDDLEIESHNLEPSMAFGIIVAVWNESSVESDGGVGDPTLTIGGSGTGDLSIELNSDDLEDGRYIVRIGILASDSDSKEWSEEEIVEAVASPGSLVSYKELEIELHTTSSSSLFGSGETHREMEKSDDETRACMTIQDMGVWGWILMGAEWVGGRETAMLTGGNAEVPPWYMATISLGMSVFFLCVQYPLMHRLYHRETDDLLTSEQMKRLLVRTIEKASKRLHIKPNLSSIKVQDRAISVDVFLPYNTSRKTIASPIDVKGTIIKDILNEFRIFGEMRPLQIRTVCTDSDMKSEGTIDFSELGEIRLSDDYSSFFSSMGQFGKLEEAFRESMSRWFRKHDVADYGSAILADEDAVFVRVIYRPVTRFAYFLFKPTYQHLQGDLRKHLGSDLESLLQGRTLVVSARNEKSTLGDRAVAGRVEQGTEEHEGEAMVAKRGGIPGALLQNPFMGDILSSVEYVAHKNRKRIDKYGFWGLIVFVWIPFMA